jgi:MurNAc alpha-1-phosphate uridylyltransferase
MSGPKTAMVLAAGLGTRLRPITDRIPKPLVEIGGRTLLDHALDRLEAAGIERAVVNVHYKAATIIEHLRVRAKPRIEISLEDELLETGGGVAKALPLLGDSFFVVNSDVLWLDGATSALTRLCDAFEEQELDAVLLLQRTATAVGYHGLGDFLLDALGAPRRRGEREIAPLLFAGVQILHRRLFDGAPQGKFSLNRLYDRALAEGRLRAIVHDGEWFHVGDPEGLALTQDRLGVRPVER